MAAAQPVNCNAISSLDCMNKIVRWFQNESVSRESKVGALALAIIATLAVGYLVGHTAIVFTAVALGAGIWAKADSVKIEKADAAFVQSERTSFEQMQEAFGGPVAWKALPIIDVDEPAYYPNMRGVDEYGRPFVLIKLRRLDNGVRADVIVEEQFDGVWRWCYRNAGSVGELHSLLNEDSNQKDWATIRQIVEGKHPQLVVLR